MYVFAIVCEIARLDDFNRGSLESSVHRRLRVSRTGIEQSESDGEYQALDERIACSGRVAFLGTDKNHTVSVYLFLGRLIR